MHIVVVGNGMVGHHLVETLLQDGDADFDITVISGEPRPAYDRVHLSEFFTGKSAADLSLADPSFYAENGVELLLADPVGSIDRADKVVVTESGRRVDYDKLVLATGSYPFVPPIPGADGAQCFVYRTIDDLEAIREMSEGISTGVVIGGGLLGLEAANALRSLGLKTSVVEFAPQLMPVQLDTEGALCLKRHIEALGVDILVDRATTEITPTGLRFADESELAAEMVVFSAGIRPDDGLARESGLAVGERGGIVIDDRCSTNDADILAIGECALWDQRIFGLVAPGYQMARVAAGVLAGEDAVFKGADMSTKLKLLGVDVGSLGDAHGRTEGSRTLRYHDEINNVYKRIVVSAGGKKLLGAILVGDCTEYETLLQYVQNGMKLPRDPFALISPNSEAMGLDAADLPDSALICSCHNVNKGAVCGAIEGGALELPAVKAATKASTGCGGCAPMLKQVFDAELASRGIEVSNDICEHFGHTRQELFHLVSHHGYTTFAELIAEHGKGLGCDICKPAVASILASLHNEPVLARSHVGLQDTNDTFLANMQKNGTYSVVPRIPGGEVTPEKLIALGEVAKRYDLYTKITGGQRIDLFGARVDQLPGIWKELIDAGFETGHAYGKALRTVKSCVGSTWCRFGVQDSVAMALLVENRYKGLRSPHKIKMAVSGCIRECAEAQSKDVGVIATENGWNLYVCGNGGMRPRHADLFATDLTDEELIRYIDRVLMFYVQTADRLQRTSGWLENLEGGLDYLRDVVINDSLGIGAELEARMATVIDTYACEWKATIEDPAKLKRFRQFVNSADSDDGLVFVRERGQRRPARDDEIIARAVG